MTTIQIVDITGKPHTLTFAPYATIKDLRSQINTKFRITSDLYWLSCCGKPLFDFLLLEEIRGTVFMHGRLMGGVQYCLKGCENEAGSRKFDSMVGRYELKCAPDDVTPENLKDLRICDKHYGSLSAKLTKLNWKHIKLTPGTKMSVKRAVTVCSHDVALDILKGPLPPEDTVGTRTYLKH